LGEIVLYFARGPASVMAARQHHQSGGGTDVPHPGLTIVQTSDSATFTSDATGHGMTVRVDKNKGGGQAQADVLRF
jgi:hypothetical protein